VQRARASRLAHPQIQHQRRPAPVVNIGVKPHHERPSSFIPFGLCGLRLGLGLCSDLLLVAPRVFRRRRDPRRAAHNPGEGTPHRNFTPARLGRCACPSNRPPLYPCPRAVRPQQSQPGRQDRAPRPAPLRDVSGLLLRRRGSDAGTDLVAAPVYCPVAAPMGDTGIMLPGCGLLWPITLAVAMRENHSMTGPTMELSDAGDEARPNWQTGWPARIRSSDFDRCAGLIGVLGRVILAMLSA
jgi:hypothetical protein